MGLEYPCTLDPNNRRGCRIDKLNDLRRLKAAPASWLARLRLQTTHRDRVAAHWAISLGNFGDALAPVILDFCGGQAPLYVPRGYRGKVLSIGSIIDRARPRDIVWGAGAWRDEYIDVPHVQYLAVRGPLTRGYIRADVPELYADPAMFLPRVFHPPVSKTFEIGIIPHYVDQHLMRSLDPAHLVINVLQPWQRVVYEILSCSLIISSSLHGVIVAEAYGIPAVWVEATGRVRGARLKFNDYYLATARESRGPVKWQAGMSAMCASAAELPSIDEAALFASMSRALREAM